MTKYRSPRMARIELKHPGLSSLITRINQVGHKAYVALLGEQNDHIVIDVAMAESVEPLSDQYYINTLNKAIGHMRLLQPAVVKRTLDFFGATATISDKQYDYHHIQAFGDIVENTAFQYRKLIRNSPSRRVASEAHGALFYAWKRIPWKALGVLSMAYPGSDIARACQDFKAVLYEDSKNPIRTLDINSQNLKLMHKLLDDIEAFIADVKHHDKAYLELRGEKQATHLLNQLAVGRKGLVGFDRCVKRQQGYSIVKRNAGVLQLINATGKALLEGWKDINPPAKATTSQIRNQYVAWQEKPELQAMLRDVYLGFEGENVVLRVPNLKLTIDLATLANINDLLTAIQAVSTFVHAVNEDFSGLKTTASMRIAHWEKMAKHFEELQDNVLYHKLHDTLYQQTGFNLLNTMGNTPEPVEFPVESPYSTIKEVVDLSTMTIAIETYGPLAMAIKDMVRILKSIVHSYEQRGTTYISYAVRKYTSVLAMKDTLDRKLVEEGLTEVVSYLNQEVKKRFDDTQFVLIKDLIYKSCN